MQWSSISGVRPSDTNHLRKLTNAYIYGWTQAPHILTHILLMPEGPHTLLIVCHRHNGINGTWQYPSLHVCLLGGVWVCGEGKPDIFAVQELYGRLVEK